MEQITAEIVGSPLRHVAGPGDDLVTGGLGLYGLRAAPPAFVDALRPTAPELRRRAIHAAYRALVDTTATGGFGLLHGPVGDRRVEGVEYLVAVRTPQGTGTTTVLLQVPDDFDLDQPCLVAVASSGSRGIYGALPTVGAWGLGRGAAVVHTDKGTGVGVWDLDRGRGYRIDGTLTDDAGDPLLGYAPADTPELAAYAREAPHTLLFKHAHSGQNPEADWGAYLLQAISVAFELLNEELAPRRRGRLAPDNTLVIAAGISNGGAAALRALERDRAGWISGALAAEPNVVVSGRTAGLSIRYAGRQLDDTGIALYDYTSLHCLYQPVAVLAESDPAAPFFAATAAERPALERWARELQDAGILPPGPIDAAARAARGQLLDAGMLPEGLALGHFNVAIGLWPSITAAYASAYARRAPWDPPFGVSCAATDATGLPRALGAAEAAALWSDANGIAPTGPVSLVVRGADGVRRAANGGSPSLALVAAPQRVLTHAPAALAAAAVGRETLLQAVHDGQREVVMTGRLGNRPVIILHGRADSLIPVNHSSRAYYAINQRDRGGRDELRYYEIERGHHFDGFLPLPAFAAAYLPLQPWIVRGLDALYDRLTTGRALPPSQVVRTRPRGSHGGAVPPLAAAHLGELRSEPGADAIRYAAGVLSIPD